MREAATVRGPVELLPAHDAQVGAITVHRALPRRGHRTVGAWCFADLMGPADVTERHGLDIGPHPHIGLQTVTWLLAGEALHRDSLGSEVVIRPGELNLMTAGWGVAHAEEATGTYRGRLQGVQLWVAQPAGTRHGAPAFEHHAALPQLELGGAIATVLVGAFAGATSPARRDTDHYGVDLALRAGETVELPLRPDYEHALIAVDHALDLDGAHVAGGVLAYLGPGRESVDVTAVAAGRALLLGGVPFDEEVVMWWNFVGRTRDEVELARQQWQAGDPRFGVVTSPLERIDAPSLHWHPRPAG